MALKHSGSSDLTVIDRFEGGVGWIAHPDEAMRRASHALESDGGLWVVEPVDAAGLDDLLDEHGDVAGVVVLFDRHERDAEAVAERHDVPVYVPSWMPRVGRSFEVPVERFDDELDGFAVDRLVDTPFWREAVLYDGESLLVPEALGTVSYFRTADERVGVHPMLRPLPPRALRAYAADRLLVGHGEGLFDDVRPAVVEAVDGARSGMPSLYLKTLREFVGL